MSLAIPRLGAANNRSLTTPGSRKAANRRHKLLPTQRVTGKRHICMIYMADTGMRSMTSMSKMPSKKPDLPA